MIYVRSMMRDYMALVPELHAAEADRAESAGAGRCA